MCQARGSWDARGSGQASCTCYASAAYRSRFQQQARCVSVVARAGGITCRQAFARCGCSPVARGAAACGYCWNYANCRSEKIR